MHALGQTPADLLQVLDDTRACPVEIGAVLKNHIDVRITKHRLRANSFDMRGSKQDGDDRIGHLVFDNIGWFTRPARMNNHLHVRNVWEGIQRYVLQRPDSC